MLTYSPDRILDNGSLINKYSKSIEKRSDWYALYVRSRHEFVTEHELKLKGYETYLPVIQRHRQWKDRKKLVDFPLFPGYLFVRFSFDPERYLQILRARGVVYMLSSEPGLPRVISSEEIDSLRLLLESGRDIDIYPNLKEGMPVRIRRGPLTGAAGVLQKKEGNLIFIVNIHILGRSISVKVSAEDVEAD